MLIGLPVVETILDMHADRIASDLPGYRNHVYRIINLIDALAPLDAQSCTAASVAAAFHDIAIWSEGTWDYIRPSIAAAERWLETAAMSGHVQVVRAMIENHHKVLPCAHGTDPLVEAFRRADWCDVTLGLRSSGISRQYYARLLCLFPAEGFHRRLRAMAWQQARRQPMRPLPMLRL